MRLCGQAVNGSLLDGLPKELTVLHWHGETYDLPDGCLHLAESEGCAVQAFEHPLALGLQLHFEVTRDGIHYLLLNCSDDIGSGPYEQPAYAILSGESVYGAQAREALFLVLDRIAAKVTRHRQDR